MGMKNLRPDTALEVSGAICVIVGLAVVHLGLGAAAFGVCLILLANFGGEHADLE